MKSQNVSPIITGIFIAALVMGCIFTSALPGYLERLIDRRANEKAQVVQAQADAALKYAAVRQMDVATDALQRDVNAANVLPYVIIIVLLAVLAAVLIVLYNQRRINAARHRELVTLLRQATGVQSQHLRELA